MLKRMPVLQFYFIILLSSLLVLGWLAPSSLHAQQPAGAGTGSSSANLPDSPKPQQQAQPNTSMGTTSRFIGYALNRSIFFPDIAHSPKPISTGEKFRLFVDQGISPAYLLGSGISAAVNQANNTPGSTGQGWGAYGTRFGYSLARASSTSFFGTFAFASALHQDPRFFPESNPKFFHALKYSAVRIFVTRNDQGRDVFNSSGLLGPAAAEALSNAYLPTSEQTASRAAARYGSDLAWRFAANVFKEYWPTLFRSMHLQSLKVMPMPGDSSKP